MFTIFKLDSKEEKLEIDRLAALSEAERQEELALAHEKGQKDKRNWMRF